MKRSADFVKVRLVCKLYRTPINEPMHAAINREDRLARILILFDSVLYAAITSMKGMMIAAMNISRFIFFYRT